MKDYFRCITGGSNDDEDGSGGNSQSRQGTGTETSVPEIGFLVVAELRCVSGEYDRGSIVFRSVETL